MEACAKHIMHRQMPTVPDSGKHCEDLISTGQNYRTHRQTQILRKASQAQRIKPQHPKTVFFSSSRNICRRQSAFGILRSRPETDRCEKRVRSDSWLRYPEAVSFRGVPRYQRIRTVHAMPAKAGDEHLDRPWQSVSHRHLVRIGLS